MNINEATLAMTVYLVSGITGLGLNVHVDIGC